MVKKNQIKKDVWFDADNLKLILLCAIFGMFGVHKFAQQKTGQGIAFILLDLTVVGLVVTFVWSLINLIQFTTKTTNPTGNIICGFVLIFVNIFAVSNVSLSEYAFLKRPHLFDGFDNVEIHIKDVAKQPDFNSDFVADTNVFNNNVSFKTSCRSTTNIVDNKSLYTVHCDCDVDKNGKHFHDSFDDTKQYDRHLKSSEQDCKKRCSEWCKLRSEAF